jgi:hypothetical protein
MENLLRGDSDDRLGKKLKPGWKAGGGNQVANKSSVFDSDATIILFIYWVDDLFR